MTGKDHGSKQAGFKPGQIVAITFLDHSEHSTPDPGALCFLVFGRVVAVTNEAVTVGAWIYADPLDKQGEDGNEQHYTIVRAAITGVRFLK